MEKILNGNTKPITQLFDGGDREFNMQCMCKRCNRSKRDDTRDADSGLVKNTGRIISRGERKSLLGNLFSKNEKDTVIGAI